MLDRREVVAVNHVAWVMATVAAHLPGQSVVGEGLANYARQLQSLAEEEAAAQNGAVPEDLVAAADATRPSLQPVDAKVGPVDPALSQHDVMFREVAALRYVAATCTAVAAILPSGQVARELHERAAQLEARADELHDAVAGSYAG